MDMPSFSTLKIYPQTVLTLLTVLENPSFVFWALRLGVSNPVPHGYPFQSCPTLCDPRGL